MTIRNAWHAALAALAAWPISARAADEPIVTPFSIITPVFTEVYNDRIGNSRFFNGANTDRLRVSAFVLPSPDSDASPVFDPSDGHYYRSTNGADTTVSFAHAASGLTQHNLTFVGATSGRGGGRDEYTFAFDRANAGVAAALAAWDATPFTMTVGNPKASDGITSVSFATADYNPAAMPAFVTDVTLTGGGLAPRLDWKVPASGTTPTAVSVQVRRIDAESADRTRITAATLVHIVALAPNATSYTFGEPFNYLPPTEPPSGLRFGERYEISVQLEAEEGGQLKGRSRTLFELAPLAGGGNEVAVYLPSVGPDGKFKFDVAVVQGEKIAIDPVYAVGYDYAIGAGDPLFRSVTLPSVGDNQFALYVDEGAGFTFKQMLAADSEYFFNGLGVGKFRVTGIEVGAQLDPSDPTAFVTTLTFAGTGRFTGTMTPLTLAVPEPSSYAMLGLGVAAVGWAARRRGSSGAKTGPR